MKEPYRKGDSDSILAWSLPGDTARWRLRSYKCRKDILRASHIPFDVDFPLFRPRRLALAFDFGSDH